DGERRALRRGDGRKEPGPGFTRRAELEVRDARPAQGAAAEQRSAHVGAAATGPPHNALGRTFERSSPGVEHAGLAEQGACGLVPLDAQLVARGLVECAPAVRADLRPDAERADEAERASGDRRAPDVELDRELASPAEVDAARSMEQAGQLGQP